MDNKNFVKIVAILALLGIAVAMIMVDHNCVLFAWAFGIPIYKLATSK